jgi:hypothetical protein
MPSPWLIQQQRWQRFGAWELRRLRSSLRDYRQSLAWMSEAWEMASRYSSSWRTAESARQHWRHLAEVQRRLARAKPRP